MEESGKRFGQAAEVRQVSLVEAALQLAAQRSPADVTTGDLAQAVGIMQDAVFRHFASKQAMGAPPSESHQGQRQCRT